MTRTSISMDEELKHSANIYIQNSEYGSLSELVRDLLEAIVYEESTDSSLVSARLRRKEESLREVSREIEDLERELNELKDKRDNLEESIQADKELLEKGEFESTDESDSREFVDRDGRKVNKL